MKASCCTGASFLTSLVQITSLSLKDCYALSIPDIRHISALSNLQHLDLSRCGNRRPDFCVLSVCIHKWQDNFRDDPIPESLLRLWNYERLCWKFEDLGKEKEISRKESTKLDRRQAFVAAVIYGSSQYAPTMDCADDECALVNRAYASNDISDVVDFDAMCLDNLDSESYSGPDCSLEPSDFDIALSWALLFPVHAIRRMNLSGCHHLTDMGVAAMGALHTLQELDMDHCLQVTGVGMAEWNSLTCLSRLSIQDSKQLSDFGLQMLETLYKGNLRHLNLSGCRKLSDKGIAFLTGLAPKLTYLNLSACVDVTNNSLMAVEQLHQLRHLDISICSDIDDQGLQRLSKLSNLTHLNLKHCWRVGDSGIHALVDLPSLRQVKLHGCQGVTKDVLMKLVHVTTDA